jgi:TonB-linked SusC/RagA family outer membrane protein
MDLTFVKEPYHEAIIKTLRIMKLTAIILLSACLAASAKGLSQRITLSVKDAPLENVFREIQKQSGYAFVYFNDDLVNTGKVNIEVKDVDLDEVLRLCVKNQPLTFTITGKIVVIKKTNLPTLNITTEPPQIDVHGKVVNENGEPVIATVTIKGTTIATSTNENGEFELKNVDEKAALIITSVNIETREIKLEGKTDLLISVKIKIGSGEEVVVKTNYWETKQRLNPGNISTITSKEIEMQPVSNPLQAMQGRVPGVFIQESTGLPGGLISIQIRGRNSINPSSGSNPLFIVDGVPFSSESFGTGFGGIQQNYVSPINSISPSDIESIEVLKDADATAIYGSRGANGVVLITTKKGNSGKTSIGINFSTGFSQVPHFMDLLSREQNLEMKKEALKNSNLWPLSPADYSKAPDVFLWDTTRYTDWQKELMGRTAKTTNARIALSGGSSKTRYLFSGSYLKLGSVFPGDFGYQKGSGLFSLNHRSENDRFSFSFSANYTIDDNHLPKLDLTDEAIHLSPGAPALFDQNGNINWENNTWLNPMATYLNPKYRATGENLITNVGLDYEVIPGLHVRSNFGYNKRDLEQLATTPFSSIRPDLLANFQVGSVFGNAKVKTWIIEPQLEYTRSLGKGKIILLAGTSFQDTKSNSEVKSATGYTSDALLENIGAAPNVRISLANAYQYRYMAVFGRVNYNLHDKYVLNLTARRDGSSRFGPENKFGNFGAAGAAWIFSEEKLFKNLRFLSFGKIRASYGITGSDNIGNYQYLDSYSPTTNPYQGITGLVPTRLANAEYGWETNKKLEAGIELKFLKRINLEVSYYKNRSSNQLVGYALPVITGQASVQRNLPATVQNTGWEFELKTENLKGAVSWLTDFSLSIPRNKLIAFPNIENSSYRNLVVGEPLSIVRGFKYTGVDYITGLYTFEDLNHDGAITDEDLQVIGNNGVDFYLGMNNSISFKGVELNFLIQAVKQTGVDYFSSFSSPPGYLGYLSNQPALVMDRWQYPGHVTDIQKFGNGGLSNYMNLSRSDRNLTDASYIKLRNVQLSYQLPVKWINKAKMKKADVFIQGQNLITLTDYVGLDPESQYSYRLPPLRTITMGIQISF